MRVALTVWENRISPLFDSARSLFIVEVENGKVLRKYYEPFNSDVPFSKPAKLSDLGVQVLVCGAVSESLANMVEAQGIRTVPFVAGEVNRVLDAYLKGILSDPDFRMPGWEKRYGVKNQTDGKNG